MSDSNIWAAGFNAFHQLSDREGDVWEFQSLQIRSTTTNGDEYDLLYPSWSSTAVRHGSKVSSLGYQKFSAEIPLNEGVDLSSPFGDHNGLLGCLDSEGKVYFLTDNKPHGEKQVFTCHGGPEAPPISHLALAGNETVAVSFKQAPNARLTHIAEFVSLASFRDWHANPSNGENYPAAHHMLPGRPKQLLANAANFILLMEDGEVYTWGDPRFRTLARPTVGAEAVPADKPGLVDALGGLKILRIQCGPGAGWLASALSEDGALYLWGTTTPGEDEGSINCLEEAGAGEVALVDILAGPDAEPADIIGACVGRNHVAVVTDAGQLYMVGDNSNGQLGLPSDQSFVGDWTQVHSLRNVQRVYAGPKATFAIMA